MEGILAGLLLCAIMAGGDNAIAQTNAVKRFRLITLDPGHFHASLVQKFMYDDVDPVVNVFAPAGADLDEHLKRIAAFNARANQPTRWREEVHAGPDFLERMLVAKPGNVVVIAGNNARKTDYILKSVQAGLNVLADKPMAVTPADFQKLRAAFDLAASNHVLLYDIMTERCEITSVLERELAQRPELFGELERGTPEDPAVIEESAHYFSKLVAGAPLQRPAWFFDVRQEGDGITDVTTHLVDLVQWEAFPGQKLSPADATVLGARRWATPVSRPQFKQVTGEEDFPDFLRGDVRDGVLKVYCNGEFTYRLRGIHARVSVVWNFEPPPGGGDTHHSVMRGTRATLTTRPDANYKQVLVVAKSAHSDDKTLQSALQKAIEELQKKYPGIGFRPEDGAWQITIPDKYNVGHEAHFAQVTESYLQYLRAGYLPDWEEPGMITKYATIMQACEMSRATNPIVYKLPSRP
jgi:predicted dehydrogenase